MHILGQFFIALGNVTYIALEFYKWVVIISALISWVSPDPYNPIVKILRQATEPLLRPIRRKLPMGGGIDFSPLVLLLLVIFAQIFVAESLIYIGRSFQQ